MASSTTTVLWREGMHFCTHVESGQLMCDESSLIGKTYPSSPELLMASLGSCIGSVLVYYAGRHDINLEGMKIDLTWELAEKPHRIGKINVAVSFAREFSAEQTATLERVANTCLIHNTLAHPPVINLQLTSR
jgi:uncharacterized OsmC-like protein